MKIFSSININISKHFASKLLFAIKVMGLVLSLFYFTHDAFARTVSSVTVGAQTGSRIYGNSGSASFVVTVGTISGGTNTSCTLSTSGLPSGVAAAFSPSSLANSASSQNTTLTLTTSATLSAAAYSFSVKCLTVANTGTLTVTPKTLTVSGTAVANKVYDGSTVASLSGGSLSGFVTGDSVSLVQTGTFSSGNVGNNLTVTAADSLAGAQSGNYVLTQPTGLKANITGKALSVTANSSPKTYGSVLTFIGTEFSTIGLVGSDAVSSVSMTSSGTLANAVVGAYSITPSAPAFSTGTASNYTITYVNGTLTVNPKVLTVTANSSSKVYGSLASYTFSSAGLANSDALSSVSMTSSGTVATAAVGTYSITPSTPVFSTGTASNYTITYVNGTLTVNPKALTVTANSSSKIYGSVATYTFSSAGLANSDAVSSVSMTSSGTVATAVVGTYSITPSTPVFSTGTASNYTITYVNDTLTVSPKALSVLGTVVANKVYDGSIMASLSGGSLSGVVNGDSVSLIQAGSFSAAGVGVNLTVTAADSLGGAQSGNYVLTQPTALMASITTAPLTITANSTFKKYGTTLTFAGTEFTAIGLLASSNISSVSLSSSGAASSAAFGTYSISASAALGGGLSNYSITYVPGVLKILTTVTSINVADFNPTAANKVVSWTVVFSDSVTGVNAPDFVLTQVSGVSNASISSVTGSGTTWTVTANTGTGVAGSLGLNLIDDDSIISAGGALGGAGAGNGNFIGQTYTLLPATCNAGANILFCDDFERSNPGSVGNGWTVTPANASNCTGQTGNTGCAGIDSDIAPFSTYTNPRANPTRSMFTRWSIVTVDSPTINLAGKFAAQLSFWLRRGGDDFSEYPELAGENFLVWYWASNNTWKILAQYPTAVLAGQVFTPVIELPPDALHAGFKARFNQTAGSGSTGSGGATAVVGYDYWHVDDVMVKEVTGPRFTGAFCDNFEAGLGRWSISAEGAPSTANIGDASIGGLVYQSASRGLDMRWGYVSAASFRTDLTGVSGNISYWVKSDASAALDPITGENLAVEYLNSAGVWTLLTTYLGSVSAGTAYSASYAIPADAKHANFRLRFRQLAGSGFDKSYWHLDDVCVGNLLPTADLSLGMIGGTLVPGSNTSYTLKVTNNGPDKLSGSMEIVDTLPAGISFLAGTGTGWVCGANGPLVTCNWAGALDSGAVAPDLVLIVAVSANVVGTITNTATVTGTVIDNVPGNNTVSFTSGVFVPTYVFTNQVCSNGFAIGQPGQPCLLATWSPQIAGQSKSSIFITGVNPLGVPTALNSVSSTSIAFQFGLTCHDPVANAGIQATFSAVSPSTLPVCNGYSAEPVVWSSPSTLSFAANVPSVATSYTFNYADVGLVELFMRNSVATTQKGTSGQFVVKPYNLVLSEIKPAANNAGRCAVATSPAPTLACASLAADAAKFVRAGEAFSSTVSVLASSGAVTPNFGKEKAPESVKLTPVNAVAGMVSPPAINGNFGNFSAGRASGLAFTWDEVGIITLTPQIADGNYLGAGDVVGTVSGPVGRFYPDHFDTTLTPGCSAGSFSYSGQPFALDVKALNASSGLTLNYAGSGGGSPVFSRNVALSDANLVAGQFSVSSVAQTAFTAGRASASSAFTFNAVSTPPSLIKLRAVDSDGVSSASGSEAVSDIRSGRARLFNAYGSELLALPVPFALEYWGANGWTKNSIDSCTSLSSSHFSFNFSSPAGTASKPNNLSACETALTVTGSAPDYLLSLAKPGKPNDGWTTLSLNLGGSSLSANGQCIAVGGAGSADLPAQLPWLQFNWKGTGPTNPVARAVFGLYKKDNAGGGVTIYRRENY